MIFMANVWWWGQMSGKLFQDAKHAKRETVTSKLTRVEWFNNAHKKQRVTCLRLTDRKLGYLFNFSKALMQHGG